MTRTIAMAMAILMVMTFSLTVSAQSPQTEAAPQVQPQPQPQQDISTIPTDQLEQRLEQMVSEVRSLSSYIQGRKDALKQNGNKDKKK